MNWVHSKYLISWLRLIIYKFFINNPLGPRVADISSSLAPPPLDQNLSVKERLWYLQSTLQQMRPLQANVIMYNFIEQYKALVLGCGASITGHFQDPKVTDPQVSSSIMSMCHVGLLQ